MYILDDLLKISASSAIHLMRAVGHTARAPYLVTLAPVAYLAAAGLDLTLAPFSAVYRKLFKGDTISNVLSNHYRKADEHVKEAVISPIKSVDAVDEAIRDLQISASKAVVPLAAAFSAHYIAKGLTGQGLYSLAAPYINLVHGFGELVVLPFAKEIYSSIKGSTKELIESTALEAAKYGISTYDFLIANYATISKVFTCAYTPYNLGKSAYNIEQRLNAIEQAGFSVEDKLFHMANAGVQLLLYTSVLNAVISLAFYNPYAAIIASSAAAVGNGLYYYADYKMKTVEEEIKKEKDPNILTVKKLSTDKYNLEEQCKNLMKKLGEKDKKIAELEKLLNEKEGMVKEFTNFSEFISTEIADKSYY